MTHLLVATTNPGKLREIRSLLADAPVELSTLADLEPIEEPEETGLTFQDNARLKARYYASRSGMMTVAEDSGLSIDGLQGEPGVLSARFLQPDASYPERFAEIFHRLAADPGQNRAARFVCTVAVVRDDRILFETAGTVEGEIADAPRGDHGFGYDPIFYYPPYGQTLAEVAEDAKLAVAHRGKAFRALAAWLREQR
ncbi:MAG TPA: RdgB/HAM1 family non-canonical purine NTP pyrophosphatase [Vicinamibacterales bacterium]|nr:RdgB/HAM1 family non-canonical purine NTP pyrophosphatase [Vicinamibacterales bacterium]